MAPLMAQSLDDALAALGITSKPRTDDLGRRDLFRGDEYLGDANAHEAWAAINNGTFAKAKA